MRSARRLFGPVVVLAVAVLGLQPGPVSASVPASWTQFGYSSAHTGYDPRETALTKVNVGALEPRWTADLGTGSEFSDSPVVGSGRVYVQAGNGELFALADSTGEILWSAAVATSAGGLSPALSGGLVIASGQNEGGATIAAFDATTGAEVWRTAPSGQAVGATPVVSGDSVYFSTGADIYSLSSATGTVRWKTTITNDADWSGVSGPVAVSANGRHVVAAGADGMLFDLSAATGNVLWQAKAGNGIYRGGPAIDNGTVYVPEGYTASEGGGVEIVALRLSNGKVIWRGYAGDDVHTTPAVAYGLVYIGGICSGFRALDARSGVQRWAIDSTPEIWSPAAIANGVVYQATESSLFAVDARTGHVLAHRDMSTGSANMSSPAISAGHVYLGSGDHFVTAFALP